jgi:Ca2+-binding EF-hand superfamily protein
MKHKTLIAGAIVALIPLAGTALANEGSMDKAGAGFDTLDTNRDGRISKAEAAADATIVWSTADANGDGYLDKSEFKKAMKSKSGDPTTPQPQPQSSPMPNDASGQPSEPVPPGEPSTTPPSDTETPRQ